jgi:hypothetical protein
MVKLSTGIYFKGKTERAVKLGAKLSSVTTNYTVIKIPNTLNNRPALWPDTEPKHQVEL